MSAASRGRLCLHAPFLYPVAAGGAGFAGGAEVQQWLFARALAARGFEVSIATCDYGQPPRVEREGVSLLRTFAPASGLPVLRFFHPRLTRTLAALARADAELYLARAAGLPAGLAYDWSRWRRSGFVYFAAHDLDVTRQLPHVPIARDRLWFRRALRGADLRIVQTCVQQRALRENFGLSSEVLANAVETPELASDAGADGVAAWMSTYKPSKRPEWMSELARRLPAIRFEMAGVLPPPPLTSEARDRAVREAAEIPNLKAGGIVERASLPSFFGRTALFVHTSPAEGFPNTLLEAWAHGVPTVSAFDPDGLIERHGLGEVAADLDRMTDAVRRWMADPEARRAAGLRARAYVEAHHSPRAFADRLIALLEPLIERVRERRGR